MPNWTGVTLSSDPRQRDAELASLRRMASRGPFWKARYDLAVAGYRGSFDIDPQTGVVKGAMGATLKGVRIGNVALSSGSGGGGGGGGEVAPVQPSESVVPGLLLLAGGAVVVAVLVGKRRNKK